MIRKALAVFCLLSLTLAAQDAPSLGETIDVSIINVDVFVTGRDGNRVRGLTRDDFEIYEDGVRQDISNFAEYSGGVERVGVEGTEAAAVDATATREPRSILVFVERMRLPAFSARPLIAQIRDIIHKTIGPEDAVSIVVWSRFDNTRHTEFTGDMQTIDAALDYVENELQTTHMDLTAQLREEAVRVRQFEADANNFGGGSKANTSLILPMLVAYGEMKVRVNAINSAISTMAGLDGKKVMLLATRRLGSVAGAEFAYASGIDDIPYDLRDRFGTESLMKSLTDMANASGVTVYPLYPLGVGSALPDASTPNPSTEAEEIRTFQNETQSLNLIAQRTGGLAAASTHDVIDLLPRIASDITDYYSLAYRVAPSGRDVAREIVVKTKDPSLTVRSRREFVEKSDETKMRDRLRATFFRAGDESQIGIEAKVGKRKRGGNTTVPLQVRIPIADLTLLPKDGGKQAGSFSVYVGAASDLDELSEITRKTQPFEVKDSQLAAAQKGYFTYDVDVKVNPKARYVAVGVLDEVGRTYGLKRVNLEETK